MTCEIKVLCLVLVTSFGLTLVDCEPKVPCYFIFGDSLLDTGNNNLLDTKSKVQFLPYGIDFPQGPTGRFSNGRNIADFIAEYLGFEDYIPPFASAKDQDILKGLNYASGSAGILEESGQHVGERISLDRQLINHLITIKKITTLLGISKANEHLNRCIYTVGMGTNDYINNYFLESTYTTSQKYTPDQYAQLLIQQYSRQLTKLYINGARKVGVSALADLGCLPFFMELYGTNGTACVARMAAAVQLFNDRLVNLIQSLNNKLPGAHFIYVPQNSTSHPLSEGVKVTDKPCCVVSRLVYKGHCIQGSTPCPIRHEYAYYDEFHPTEFVMKIRASMAFSSYSPFYEISGDVLKPNHETNVLVASK